LPRIPLAALVSTVMLTIWPSSGQEVTPKPPADNSVCFHIRVVPKGNVDSAIVLKRIENPDKGMSLLPFLPPNCEHRPQSALLRSALLRSGLTVEFSRLH
jgi:hypothetical protein